MFPGEITLHSSIVISGGAIVVLGSTQYQYMLAFRTTYSMEPVEGEFPIYYTAADWAWRDLYENVVVFQP